jgi:O-antigen biosynthesis protein
MKSESSNNFFAHKIKRLKVLTQTAHYLYKTEGLLSLTKNLLKFFLGYRQNVIIPLTKPEFTLDEKKLYQKWIEKYENHSIIPQVISYQPLISIITPVFNTNPFMLKKMFESVLAQTYQNWELCIADGCSTNSETIELLKEYEKKDSRIKISYLTANKGIAGNTNESLSLAEGEFAALLDHDDELTPNALMENIILLNAHPLADMIYSDEDKLDEEGFRCNPHFKPQWSPDLFNSMMFTCHLGVYRKSIIDEIGGFRPEFDGAQDYDMVLRFTEKTTNIFHIPKILYHWRISAGSTASSLGEKNYAREAQIKAVAEHFKRLNIEASVTAGLADNLVRVKRHLKTSPKVSIIIPTCDKLNLLKTCVESIRNKTGYKNYEILIINNNSREKETFDFFAQIQKETNIEVLDYLHPFNFSAINNFAAKNAKGEILLFLNNDTEVITEEWLESMVEHTVRPEVGAVGARLLFPDNTIQHAGVILGIGGVAGHSHKHFHQNHPGYFSRASAIQNLSAVTAACLMVKKEVFESLDGFDEKNLAIAFNDVDFCLRLRQKGLLIIYTPYAKLYHYESVSRGQEDSPEKVARFNKEIEYMQKTWSNILLTDPYYNPNLTLKREDFSIKTD